ncbi:MAG: ferredoxin domain-containing protein, partial [Hadesarchaea archaeon]|nr:ferredoxin domain-containing protein [Hadesarchaea archaeon]
LGSAAKTASLLNADNRMMFSAGVAARKAGMMEADVVIALPLSATGKSPFFDRAQSPPKFP